MKSKKENNAELLFRDAFNRIVNNETIRLRPGTKLTQNNVAREAGRDPSALKKDRYPSLVMEIQGYILSQRKIVPQKKEIQTNNVRSLLEQLKDCRVQRDKLMSIVNSQNEYIQELLAILEGVKKRRVVKIK